VGASPPLPPPGNHKKRFISLIYINCGPQFAKRGIVVGFSPRQKFFMKNGFREWGGENGLLWPTLRRILDERILDERIKTFAYVKKLHS